jgi:frataxin
MGMTATTAAAQRIKDIVSVRRGRELTRRDSRVMNGGPLLPLPLIANYSTSLDEPDYHKVADETLESIVDLLHPLDDGDDEVEIDLSQGVLSIDLGPSRNNMTWVINKQSPNKQLWWSSPIR